VDRVEVEVAALPGVALERHLVADPDVGDRVEILGHAIVGLAARVEGDEQQAARGQPLLAQLTEAEDDRRGIAVVIDAGRDQGGPTYIGRTPDKIKFAMPK
jgi:hypothetical protein